MSSILIKDAVVGDGGITRDILMRGGVIADVAPRITESAEKVISCNGRKAVLPPFFNCHTHVPMTLLRGYADDYELFTWLSKYIWPAEANLTRELVYAGTRLACLEMIKTGTVFFNDSYFFQLDTVRAVEEMGLRACIGLTKLTTPDGNLPNSDIDALLSLRGTFSPRVQLALCPHAIYTVSEPDLRLIGEQFAVEKDLFLHMHLSETKHEFETCLKEHGMTPVEYVDSLGLLDSRSILAHAVYLTDGDFDIVSRRGCVLVNNPVSNMKLGCGVFNYSKAVEKNIRLAIGTDGTSSNNNLSMIEETKIAALSAKFSGNPELLNAESAFIAATKTGAEAFGISSGAISVGMNADCMIIDLESPCMTPCFHLLSNMVYAADPACIETVICAGRILMEDHFVPGEAEIISEGRRAAMELIRFPS